MKSPQIDPKDIAEHDGKAQKSSIITQVDIEYRLNRSIQQSLWRIDRRNRKALYKLIWVGTQVRTTFLQCQPF